MIVFDYVVSDEMGLHARPVGLVVKSVTPYKNTKITVAFHGKTADAKRMFAIMALQVKQGDTITVSVEGEDEQLVAEKIRAIFESEKL